MNDFQKNVNTEELNSFENNQNQEKNDNDIKKNILNSTKVKLNNENIVLNTKINITVELGRKKIKIKDFLNLKKDNILILDKSTEESLDIFVNDCLFASGEIVVLEDQYGLRINKIYNSLKKL